MPEVNLRLVEQFRRSVAARPFACMRLPPDAAREHLGSYLLGAYEQELHPWVERLVAAAPPVVNDVRAKFGYYAVGLARRLPSARVFASDTDWWTRRAAGLVELATGGTRDTAGLDLSFLPPAGRGWAADELRGEPQWLLFTPHISGFEAP